MRTQSVTNFGRQIVKNWSRTVSSQHVNGGGNLWTDFSRFTTGAHTCLTISKRWPNFLSSSRRRVSTGSSLHSTTKVANSNADISISIADEAKTSADSADDAATLNEDAIAAPALESDADAVRYFADILGRRIVKSSKGERRTVVVNESGIIAQRLLEQYPDLDIRAVYRSRKACGEIHDRLQAEFPNRYSAVEVNIWNAIVGNDHPNAVADMETIFYGKEESDRRESKRNDRSVFADECEEAADSPSTVDSIDDDILTSSSSISSSSATSLESSSASTHQDSRLSVFTFVKQNSTSRLTERFVDAITDPETSLLGPFVRDADFYCVMSSNVAPVDLTSVYGQLPKIESMARGENLVLVTAKKFQGTQYGMQQKYRNILMETFYDVSAHAVVCPYVVNDSSLLKLTKKSVLPFILVRIRAKAPELIKIKPERRSSFVLFVMTLCSASDKRVIPAVEEFLPDMGHDMIMEADFTMSELTRDLTADRIVPLFEMMADNPMYPESVFGMVESGRMDPDEWLKKRIIVKRGFVKASFIQK